MKKKNRGFTLVEMVVVISIFAILLGILVPSLNSVLGFRVQRAVNSIAAALDKTRVEAMNRLVGEMMLERREDGYYISYYLDRGKTADTERVKQDQPEKIAPSRTIISYTTEDGIEHPLDEGTKLILTYNRENGSFRKIQYKEMTQDKILEFLSASQDINFNDSEHYCTTITIKGGSRTRVIKLEYTTGKYTITA